MPDYTLDRIADFIGCELGVSDWLTVGQDRIDAFAEVTGDHQWIHTDIERAAREAPGGTTIAHGLLTLSLLPTMRANLGLVPEGVGRALNYGYDRIRFLAPVPPGARLRTHTLLTAAEPKGGGWLVTTRNTVEIEGADKPALVADALTLFLPA